MPNSDSENVARGTAFLVILTGLTLAAVLGLTLWRGWLEWKIYKSIPKMEKL